MEMEGKRSHIVSNETGSFSNHYIYRISKRSADILISLCALVFLSPIFLLVWILDTFSISNRGPVFYRQIRVGYHGKKFGMYKFRSMVVGAEQKLYKNEKMYKEYVANNYKLEPDNDPRITKLGQFLRKSSIDEIPQFINILFGDMSIVGPRPVIEPELSEYSDVNKLLSIKPGAMGLWQASGRSNIGYPERASIEMTYVDDCSFFLDIKIIFMNVFNIFRGKGAY
ncbi:exopolysaccharide biosynthesis protein [Companilactobacillus nantensis]|nr:exopolysaccharide biosynthesis protein [Companilactobacillus nantensis]